MINNAYIFAIAYVGLEFQKIVMFIIGHNIFYAFYKVVLNISTRKRNYQM